MTIYLQKYTTLAHRTNTHTYTHTYATSRKLSRQHGGSCETHRLTLQVIDIALVGHPPLQGALGPCRVQIQPLPAQLWTPAHSSRTSAQASGSIEASHGCLLWSSQPKPELDAALFIMLVSLRRRPVAWLDMWADDREQERAVGQPASRR